MAASSSNAAPPAHRRSSPRAEADQRDGRYQHGDQHVRQIQGMPHGGWRPEHVHPLNRVAGGIEEWIDVQELQDRVPRDGDAREGEDSQVDERGLGMGRPQTSHEKAKNQQRRFGDPAHAAPVGACQREGWRGGKRGGQRQQRHLAQQKPGSQAARPGGQQAAGIRAQVPVTDRQSR